MSGLPGLTNDEGGEAMTKVLITGGGIGGISTALSLVKHGFNVEVYEQASELMEIGAGIQLSANAMHVLLAHGLEPQLSKLWVKPSAYVFRLHDTGEIISRNSFGGSA